MTVSWHQLSPIATIAPFSSSSVWPAARDSTNPCRLVQSATTVTFGALKVGFTCQPFMLVNAPARRKLPVPASVSVVSSQPLAPVAFVMYPTLLRTSVSEALFSNLTLNAVFMPSVTIPSPQVSKGMFTTEASTSKMPSNSKRRIWASDVPKV